MTIQVPKFAQTIKDEGVLTLIAFCTRIANRYGYQETYSIHVDDVIRICNKRSQSIAHWLQTNPVFSEWLDLGQPFDDQLVFHWRRTPEMHDRGMAAGTVKLVEIELQDIRQQLVWAYLLGCLNTNVLDDNIEKHWLLNSYGQKSFHLTREGRGYIKIADRE